MDNLQSISGTDISSAAINKINGNFNAIETKIEEIEESGSGGGETPVIPSTVITPKKSFFKTSAHRGSSVGITGTGKAENTLAAIHNAAIQGFDIVEVDPKRCSDGVFVLCHDREITDKDDNKYTVANITSAEATSKIVHTGSDYGDITVPTLKEALNACYQYGLECILDSAEGTSTEVVNDVIDAGMAGRVYYGISGLIVGTTAEVLSAKIIEGMNSVIAEDPNAKFFYGGYMLNTLEALRSAFELIPSALRQRLYLYVYVGGVNYHPESIAIMKNLGINLIMINIQRESEVKTALSHRPQIIQVEIALGTIMNWVYDYQNISEPYQYAPIT